MSISDTNNLQAVWDQVMELPDPRIWVTLTIRYASHTVAVSHSDSMMRGSYSGLRMMTQTALVEIPCSLIS